jgi:hypothetical protein
MQYCTFYTSRFITVVTQKGRTVGPWRLRWQLAVPTGQSLPPALHKVLSTCKCLRGSAVSRLLSGLHQVHHQTVLQSLLRLQDESHGRRSTCPADITLHGQSAFRLRKLQQSFRTVATSCQSSGCICALISTGCCGTTQPHLITVAL